MEDKKRKVYTREEWKKLSPVQRNADYLEDVARKNIEEDVKEMAAKKTAEKTAREAVNKTLSPEELAAQTKRQAKTSQIKQEMKLKHLPDSAAKEGGGFWKKSDEFIRRNSKIAKEWIKKNPGKAAAAGGGAAIGGALLVAASKSGRRRRDRD